MDRYSQPGHHRVPFECFLVPLFMDPNEQKRPEDWSIYNVRGGREAVIAKVNAAKIPMHVKAFIVEEVAALPKECVGASVNGYGQAHPRPGSHELPRQIQVTVVGISL